MDVLAGFVVVITVLHGNAHQATTTTTSLSKLFGRPIVVLLFWTCPIWTTTQNFAINQSQNSLSLILKLNFPRFGTWRVFSRLFHVFLNQINIYQ
jgi:hypothetical protein